MNTRQKKLTTTIQISMEPEMLEWLKEKTKDTSDVSKYIRYLIRREMINE